MYSSRYRTDNNRARSSSLVLSVDGCGRRPFNDYDNQLTWGRARVNDIAVRHARRNAGDGGADRPGELQRRRRPFALDAARLLRCRRPGCMVLDIIVVVTVVVVGPR